MRRVVFFRVRLSSGQRSDEKVLNSFIGEVKVRKIVPGLVQNTIPNYWSIYVEYEESNKEFGPRKKGEAISKPRGLKAIRRQYPRAYEKWTNDEDTRLQSGHSKGLSLVQLSETLQRRPSAIRSRLQKLGIVE